MQEKNNQHKINFNSITNVYVFFIYLSSYHIEYTRIFMHPVSSISLNVSEY